MRSVTVTVGSERCLRIIKAPLKRATATRSVRRALVFAFIVLAAVRLGISSRRRRVRGRECVRPKIILVKPFVYKLVSTSGFCPGRKLDLRIIFEIQK
jgi:hypothetical protein